MLIAILNQSTLVSNADAATMTQAVAAQVRFDAAPMTQAVTAQVQARCRPLWDRVR